MRQVRQSRVRQVYSHHVPSMLGVCVDGTCRTPRKSVLTIPSRGPRKGSAKAQSALAAAPDESSGLASLDDEPGLIPLGEAPGLEVLDDTAGLVPLEAQPSLTPLAEDPLTSAAAYQSGTAAMSPSAGGPGPNPFADDFGSPGAMTVNPYQSPALASSGYAAAPSRPFNQAIVVAPAIAMLVVLAINFCVMIPYLIVYAIGAIAAAKAEQGGDQAAFMMGFVVGSITGVLIFVAAYLFMLFGAWKMMRLESYGLAVTTSILMMLPCTFCWIGLPFGIWALVVLCLRDVRQAFT